VNAQCGGAQSRTRPTATRRRRGTQGKRRETVPSLHTGRQTAIKRKAGARVTSKYAFTGEGSVLDSDGDGKGFGKQAARYVRGIEKLSNCMIHI
jgi:DNA-dependent metalloprotease WSS1